MFEQLLSNYYYPVKQGNIIFKLDPETISDISGSGIDTTISKSPNIGSSQQFIIDGKPTINIVYDSSKLDIMFTNNLIVGDEGITVEWVSKSKMVIADNWLNEISLFDNVDISKGISLQYGNIGWQHRLILSVDNYDSSRKSNETKITIKNDSINRWALVIHKTYTSLYRNGKILEFDVKGTNMTKVPLRIFSPLIKKISFGILGTLLNSQERFIGTVIVTDVAKYDGPRYNVIPL